MRTDDLTKTMARLFSELVDGAHPKGGVVLNTGDTGLLRSLDKISAAEASQRANDGATIAAHAQHLRRPVAHERVGDQRRQSLRQREMG